MENCFKRCADTLPEKVWYGYNRWYQYMQGTTQLQLQLQLQLHNSQPEILWRCSITGMMD